MKADAQKIEVITTSLFYMEKNHCVTMWVEGNQVSPLIMVVRRQRKLADVIKTYTQSIP